MTFIKEGMKMQDTEYYKKAILTLLNSEEIPVELLGSIYFQLFSYCTSD